MNSFVLSLLCCFAEAVLYIAATSELFELRPCIVNQIIAIAIKCIECDWQTYDITDLHVQKCIAVCVVDKIKAIIH